MVVTKIHYWEVTKIWSLKNIGGNNDSVKIPEGGKQLLYETKRKI